ARSVLGCVRRHQTRTDEIGDRCPHVRHIHIAGSEGGIPAPAGAASTVERRYRVIRRYSIARKGEALSFTEEARGRSARPVEEKDNPCRIAREIADDPDRLRVSRSQAIEDVSDGGPARRGFESCAQRDVVRWSDQCGVPGIRITEQTHIADPSVEGAIAPR